MIIKDIAKGDNKLLKAVHSDLPVQSYLGHSTALGLIKNL